MEGADDSAGFPDASEFSFFVLGGDASVLSAH